MGNKNEEVIELDLLQLMKALWRRMWILILAMLLGGALVLGGTVLFLTPTYKASVLMYVNSTDTSSGGAKVSVSQGELSAAKSLIDTYTVILKTRTTLNEVIEQSGVSYGFEALTEMISAESVNGTEVFKVDVEAPDPVEATTIANTIAQVLPEKIASIVEGSTVRIVDMAVEPTEQASPSYVMNTAVGILLGLVLAAGTIVVMELMDDKIHGPDYLTQTYDLPVLAATPDGMDPQTGSSLGPNLGFAAAEAYKLLRTNLNFSMPDTNGCKVIGFTSPLHGEGKSTTAINVAYTMAQTGSRVLLLEADLRLPSLSKCLGAKQVPGLSNLLVGQCTGSDVIQSTKLINGLWTITAGDICPNPAELLGSSQMKATIETLAAIFDVIIVDLPPVTVVSDALVISKALDGMVLAVRQDYCDRGSLDASIRQLRFAGVKILGVVMTCAGTQAKDNRRKNYGYYRERQMDVR